MRKDKKIYLDSPGTCLSMTSLKDWVDSTISDIPNIYLDSAMFDINASGDDDYGYEIEVDCYYYRPETDDEMNERISQHEKTISLFEQRELAQLAALKAKYEKKPRWGY